MKKFRICLKIKTEQSVFYEVEAKNREKLDKLLESYCVEDLGKCVDEDTPEVCEETIDDIQEIENN